MLYCRKYPTGGKMIEVWILGFLRAQKNIKTFELKHEGVF